MMNLISSVLFFLFFFKQKTAYELRISDWSSDVCSSDLAGIDAIGLGRGHRAVPARRRPDLVAAAPAPRDDAAHAERNPRTPLPRSAAPAPRGGARGRDYPGAPRARSEEHTSELQSLMRNSYAVFCLKKKKTTQSVRAP